MFTLITPIAHHRDDRHPIVLQILIDGADARQVRRRRERLGVARLPEKEVPRDSTAVVAPGHLPYPTTYPSTNPSKSPGASPTGTTKTSRTGPRQPMSESISCTTLAGGFVLTPHGLLRDH